MKLTRWLFGKKDSFKGHYRGDDLSIFESPWMLICFLFQALTDEMKSMKIQQNVMSKILFEDFGQKKASDMREFLKV